MARMTRTTSPYSAVWDGATLMAAIPSVSS